jgi:hypothetical protein
MMNLQQTQARQDHKQQIDETTEMYEEQVRDLNSTVQDLH